MTSPADRTSPLLDHCPPTLPPEAYWHPDWAERERRGIWARQWVYVGRRDGFAPGTMRRVEIAGDNLIVVCAADGSLSLPQHLPAPGIGALCRAPAGLRRPGNPLLPRLGLRDRRTTGVDRLRHADAGFRQGDHGLFPVALEVWNGFVFLCLADDLPPLSRIWAATPSTTGPWTRWLSVTASRRSLPATGRYSGRTTTSACTVPACIPCSATGSRSTSAGS